MGKPMRRSLPAAAVLAYLLGTFPTADVVALCAARCRGAEAINLREAGTGNPGALNAAKVLGLRWGVAVLAGDFLKGAVASLLGRRLAGDNGVYAAGAAVVLGHCAPAWHKFRGGKGLATSAGTAIVCFPVYAPLGAALATSALAISQGRANAATYATSACFVLAATYWRLTGKGNAWGPRPTVGLPFYAASSSAMVVYRFMTAPRPSELGR